MFSKSQLKDYIGILYYRHGLFCASNPIKCMLLVSVVLLMCCYPLKNLSSFSSSLEQYKQSIGNFDGLEANAEIDDSIEYDRLPDRPAWYNRIPIAYIQRIVIKSVFKIPKKYENSDKKNSTYHTDKNDIDKLYMIDAFRTPIAQLFDINEFIRNFRTENHSSNTQKSLVSDLCVHVGELASNKMNQNERSERKNEFNKHFLPEFNCLYLSPTNFWSNDFNLFKQDDDLMQTINDSANFKKINKDDENEEINLDGLLAKKDSQSSEQWFSSIRTKLISYFNNQVLSKKSLTHIRELLFSISWPHALVSLDDDKNLKQKLSSYIEMNKSSTVVFTYAITIALKKYDKSFLDELKLKLEKKFNFDIYKINNNDYSNGDDNKNSTNENKNHLIEESNEHDNQNTIVNLQYTKQSFVYYIPYAVLYLLLFLYIYISVRKIEFVKSKWGLAFAAVSQVVASLLMSVGICSFFGLTPTLNGGEIFPYLMIFIGFENIVVLTKSVVSTPFDLDVRYRIALGLKKESWVITKILSFELVIIFFGIFTMVPAIQEFCVFAYVGLLIDFFMQMIFFITVLSIDIRRMELSDLNKQMNSQRANSQRVNQKFDDEHEVESFTSNETNQSNSNIINVYGSNQKNSPINRLSHRENSIKQNEIFHNMNDEKRNNHVAQTVKKKNISSKFKNNNYSSFFTNKSVQFFYFWARTRIVQRAIILLTILWIILICYKSLLIVELMRYDVNVKKETVEALLPKGVGLPKLIKDNFQQYFFSTTSPPSLASNTLSSSLSQEEIPSVSIPRSSTIDYIKQHFQSFIINQKTSVFSSSETFKSTPESSSPLSKIKANPTDHSWQTLNYFHWLTLFSNYNVSLYNRYVAILPQINLHNIVKSSEILKYRNLNEIQKYNTVITIENEHKFNLNTNTYSNINTTDTFDNPNILNYKSALFELFGIVVFGIPTIIIVVYVVILFYKCLCSKNYEQWRQSWSTSNIKRQYKIIHSKVNRKHYNLNDGDSLENKNEISKHEHQKKSLNNTDSSHEDTANNENDDSEDSNYYYETKSESDRKLSRDDLINQIINGKQDHIDLRPITLLNTHLDDEIMTHHQFSIDLIACGNDLCVTVDISNQIKVWSLSSMHQQTSGNNLVFSIQMDHINSNNNNSIWSITLTNDDRYLFVGQSSGQLTAFDLFSKDKSNLFFKNSFDDKVFNLNNKAGITHLIQIKINSFNANMSKKTNSNYYLVAARLNGYLELIKFNYLNTRKEEKFVYFNLLSTIRVHESPITNLNYSENGSYLMTTSQDCLLKIIKINKSSSVSVLPSIMGPTEQEEKEELSLMFVLNEHGESIITAMCIDSQNTLNAATGSQNGVICLWNLFTGQCKFKFDNRVLSSSFQRRNKMTKALSPILKLELCQNLLVSLNSDQQMCIWNTASGTLIKEFKFFAPTASISSITHGDNLNMCIDTCSNFSSINMLVNGLAEFFKAFFANHLTHNTFTRTIPLDELAFQPPPTMCLYSKTILITGGFSCIFLWNIAKGELFKKINIKTKAINISSHNNNQSDSEKFKYSSLNLVKQIKVIQQKSLDSNLFSSSNLTSINKSFNKLLLIMDYTDSIYILKIPSNIIQNFS